ncbi:MAG: SCO family protein [Caldilineaceae bacterium]
MVGTNWDGTPFDLSALRGKVALIFFGYTACPDICPVTLAEMKQVYNQLGDAREDVAVVFVTVDPERDSVERLAQYIPAFDPAFYGVYIPPEQQESVKKGYGVFAEKRDPGDSSSVDYLVDHSGWIYGVDTKGNLRTAYGHDTPMAEDCPRCRPICSAGAAQSPRRKFGIPASGRNCGSISVGICGHGCQRESHLRARTCELKFQLNMTCAGACRQRCLRSCCGT